MPVNHASRAYLALNATVEGSTSKARLIEVTNANHFDSFANALPSLIVPLHVYLFRALDAVSANLKSGTALPPSQVVRTPQRQYHGHHQRQPPGHRRRPHQHGRYQRQWEDGERAELS